MVEELDRSGGVSARPLWNRALERVGAGEKGGVAALRPDRYYLVNDAGSFYFNPHGENAGFASPEEAPRVGQGPRTAAED